jgi:hypothetical protein
MNVKSAIEEYIKALTGTLKGFEGLEILELWEGSWESFCFS